VRLLVTVGTGDQAVYHFDGFWPTRDKQCRMVVDRTAANIWQVTLLSESVAP